MLENININELLSTYIIPFSIKIFFAILIFIVGRMVVKAIVGLLKKILTKAKMDVILVNFVSSIVNAVLLLFIVVAALDQLGVNTSSLIALVGAAGLAIGLALQGSLQNFAAGVMMIIFRPFKSGDFIEAGGVTGVVEMISIFSTTLRTGDNREIIIPNGSIYSSAITNYSARETRRIDMVFGIGYEDNIKQAKQIMQSIVDADDRILNDPKTLIAVSELADSSVNFVLRPWVKSNDYWAVKFDVTEKIKEAFDDNNISIPYPQIDLHMNKVE
jgi:small conductance mechanosensitive channel